MDLLKTLVKQPYWVIALIVGAALVAVPCVTIDKDYHWAPHGPSTLLPVIAGLALLLVSTAGFLFNLLVTKSSSGAGLDLSRVQESKGVLFTNVAGCEIRAVNGRIEEYVARGSGAVVLPCNEYFDDRCAADTKSALGAYVNRAFDGQAVEFVSLMQQECVRHLGSPHD